MDPRELKVVNIDVGNDWGSIDVTFANDIVEYKLYDTEGNDYYEAYTACVNKTEWSCDSIKVYSNGIVKIFATEYGDVCITLPVASCVNAFKEVYDQTED